jgi:hypothetical protein
VPSPTGSRERNECCTSNENTSASVSRFVPRRIHLEGLSGEHSVPSRSASSLT